MKISGANRVSETDLPPYDDVTPMAHALIEAAPERIMWGTDWPHPNKYIANPNDGDLVDWFGDWVPDAADAAEDHGRHAGEVLPVLEVAGPFTKLYIRGEAAEIDAPHVAVSKLPLNRNTKEPPMSDAANTPAPEPNQKPQPVRSRRFAWIVVVAVAAGLTAGAAATKAFSHGSASARPGVTASCTAR